MAIGSNYYQYGTPLGPIQDIIILGFTVFPTQKADMIASYCFWKEISKYIEAIPKHTTRS